MVAIESTPQMVARSYSTTAKNLQVVRRRLGRPLSLADKLLLGHLDDPEGQELAQGESQLALRPDRVALQDVLGQTVMLNFMQTQRDSAAVPTTIHCDHLVQARVEGGIDLVQSLEENDEVYSFLRSAAAKFGAGFWGPGAGIIHQVVLENYAFPGAMIIGTDSHTPNAGGLGACAVGVGGADAVEVMAGLNWELLYPRYIGVRLTGEMGGWTAPKDVILRLAGELTVSGGTNAIIEYFGPGASSISCTGKATITNMGAELGATTSVFPYDERMERYLRATDRGDLADLANANSELVTPDAEVADDPRRYFDRLVEIDLSTLEPHVVGPHSPDRARPISMLAAEVADDSNGFIDAIDTALIGSCTNSSYEDMSRAADVADQAREHNVAAAGTPLMVTPGSEQVRSTIQRDGQMASLQAIDATVLANACGPLHRSVEARKAPRRHTQHHRHLLQPQLPAAQRRQVRDDELHRQPRDRHRPRSRRKPVVQPPHRRAHRRRWLHLQAQRPPVRPPRSPLDGFDPGESRYVAPPEDGGALEIAIDPDSDRLEPLHPWPAWDGNDYIRLPVLVKTKGKTTTDHISPAGPWLKYRGHLTKFSENMFMGAANAFTGETGKGRNILTGETGRAFSQTAGYYRDAGLRWVVIGDDNYGEGSSREHAALSPKLLGGAAVIARSFARIHESNLKKQGLLPLTFQDPAHYDLIREDDRISLTGLAHLAPNKPVLCTIHHADDTTETIHLDHSMAANQIPWFQAGSALNMLGSCG